MHLAQHYCTFTHEGVPPPGNSWIHSCLLLPDVSPDGVGVTFVMVAVTVYLTGASNFTVGSYIPGRFGGG